MNAFQNIDAILSYLICVKKNVFVISQNTLILSLIFIFLFADNFA